MTKQDNPWIFRVAALILLAWALYTIYLTIKITGDGLFGYFIGGGIIGTVLTFAALNCSLLLLALGGWKTNIIIYIILEMIFLWLIFESLNTDTFLRPLLGITIDRW